MSNDTEFISPVKVKEIENDRDEALMSAKIQEKCWGKKGNFIEEDDDIVSDDEEETCCVACGGEVDIGVCLFDIRYGEFVPAYRSKKDFFCNRECLFNFMFALKKEVIEKT